MVRILIFLILTFRLFESEGQGYIPMLGENNVWVVHYNGIGISGEGVYFTGKDTIINENRYLEFMTKSKYQIYLFGYLMEDTINQKVYFFKKEENSTKIDLTEAFLWYDFSLNVGDTIVIVENPTYLTDYRKDTLCVDSVSHVFSNYYCYEPLITLNNKARIFYLHNTTSNWAWQEDQVIWVEGTGSIAGPEFPFWVGCSWDYSLICHSRNKLPVFTYGTGNFSGDTCYYDFTSAIEKQNLPIISVFPNPANNRLEIEITAVDNKEKYIRLLSIDSKTLFSTVLRQDESYIEVSLDGFAPGVYIVSVEVSGKYYYRKIVKLN
ncbi:MAG: T9SS type A sorting domain-containing protein [Bacteroidia bacterium]